VNGVCTGGGTGGATGSGGAPAATGGAPATGGATAAAGGTTSSGGAPAATGGETAMGGDTSTGGETATGGAAGTGGTTDDTGCRVWMATNGSDSADCGSASSPCLTLLAAYNVVCPPPPSGTENGAECLGAAPRTLCIKPGTYSISERFELKKTRMGTSSNPIIIQGDPTSTSKPVLDFSSQPRVEACGAEEDSSGGELTGITMNANWTELRNVEITGANDNCVKVQGANNLVENVVAHHCADTGIQISAGSGYTASGTNNTILNCDSYQNNDTQCNGENADGFSIKEGSGAGNVFRGCRAWDNADDGWDLYAWTDPVRIENCWAMRQSATTEGSNSDGNGFKLGGDDVSVQHILVDLIAVDNNNGSNGCGFTENSNPANMTCTGTCAAWGNTTNVDSIGGVSTSQIGSVTSAQMIGAQRGADGSLPDINSL
jgi:hypothetical protein